MECQKVGEEKEESNTDNLHMQTLSNVPQRLYSPLSKVACYAATG